METCYTFVNDNIVILKKRCLLTINDKDELEMHNLLRDMGREIARNDSPDEPGKHSRLWASKDIYDVLKKHKGTEAIEGIIFSNFNYQDAFEEVSFSTKTFKRMSNLRFLYLKKVNLTGSFEQTFEDLRWLFWDYCPLKCLPAEFHPEELVILELPCSKMTTMWELNNVDSQVFEKLTTLNMSYSLDLTITPDFTKLPCLKILNFEGCISLEEVHRSIGCLVWLVSLNLGGCVNLGSIPDSICNLRALESLNIGSCSSLETLFSKLLNIESLTVSKLPIRHHSKLVELNLSDNEYLETPSSSASDSTPTRWDVFLNLRDIDTIFTFPGQLYSFLHRHGVRAFMDSIEIHSLVLSQAIQESKTYIVVLSENYASSPWCLDELVEILNCHKTMGRLVIPVFYNIVPAVVRYQTGSFKLAFEKYEIRYAGEMEKVNKWRLALTEVAEFSGCIISKHRDESEIINEIVDVILREIKPKTLHVADYPVGLDSRVKGITTALLSSATEEGVIKIGIYGMGGVGKTTLAKAIFNQLLLGGSFKGSCFLANVREISGILKGLVTLQEQLVNDVLKMRKKVKVHNLDEGIKLIEDSICSTKVLVVLDDIDDHKQFESLVGPFASGSVVIITTRNQEILDKIEVETKYRYRVNELDDAQSLALFSQHAFGNAEPNNTLMLLSKYILRHAGGLPLALEVFGSYLYNRSEAGWKYYIEKLERVPNSTIQQRLIISLDALESDDPMLKKIFLDIACFFVGREKEEVVKIMKTYYNHVDHNIDILKKRCLLTINNRDELEMHHLLRDLGREIARNCSPDEPGKHSRLWIPEDIFDVLKKHKGTEAVEGIIPRNRDALEGESFSTKTFKRMSKLRFLFLKKVNLTGSFEQTFEDLRWLFWDYCPLKCLPAEFHPEKLVILELPRSKMTTMWEPNMVSHVLEKLKTLNMSFSQNLTTTPDFTKLPCLESLNLKCCESLKEVHISIGSLVRLVSLDLHGCVKLETLPDTICNLRALEVLSIGNCTSLKALPTELGNIESLKGLNADGLSVSKIPDSIGRLSKLVELRLSYNKNLETLPDTIYNLRSLENLDLGYCSHLLYIARFSPNLKLISADGCTSMQRLPNLSNLKQLEELDLIDCSGLTEIIGLEELTSVRALHLAGCNSSLLAYFTKRLFQVLVQTGEISRIHKLYKQEKYLESDKH